MRWIGLAAAVAALAFAVAGCGSSSDSGSEAAADTAVTETSSATDTSSSTETTATETTSTETTSTETTSTETSGSLAGLTGECKDLAEAGEKFGAAFSGSASGGTGDLDKTADAFKEFAKQAPDELKDDFETLADVFAVYAVALKDIDFKAGSAPTAEQIAKLTKLGQSLNSADVTKASAAIAAWGEAHCGVTP